MLFSWIEMQSFPCSSQGQGEHVPCLGVQYHCGVAGCHDLRATGHPKRHFCHEGRLTNLPKVWAEQLNTWDTPKNLSVCVTKWMYFASLRALLEVGHGYRKGLRASKLPGLLYFYERLKIFPLRNYPMMPMWLSTWYPYRTVFFLVCELRKSTENFSGFSSKHLLGSLWWRE